VKFGGVATHQARRAVAAIARLAGVDDAPTPASRSCTADCSPAAGRGVSPRAATPRARRSGGPPAKIAGEYLPRWLADHGVAAPAAAEPPAGGVTIRRRLRDMRGAEARYLYDLARRFDRDDPPTAALGRRTHATHAR
jgi:hypothetical protein